MIFISQEVPLYGSLSTTSVLRALVMNLQNAEKIHYLGFRSVGSKKQIDNPDFTYTIITLPRRGERYFRFLFLPILFAAGLWRMLSGKHSLVFAAFPDDASLLLGYLLSVFGSKKFYPYFMDLYTETGVWAQPLDKWLQKRVFAKAEKVVVINEGMQSFYKENYNKTTVCLPHVYSSEPAIVKNYEEINNSFTIGYSGTVNGARIAGLRNLNEALLNLPNTKLCIFSPQDEIFLRAEGLWHKKIEQTNITDSKQLLNALSSCDALYIPVYAGKIDKAQIETSFGGKMVEYLASGVPIIIDADKNFFTYKFMKKHDVGILLEHNSVPSIEKCIEALQSNSKFYSERAHSNSNLTKYFSREMLNKVFHNEIIEEND